MPLFTCRSHSSVPAAVNTASVPCVSAATISSLPSASTSATVTCTQLQRFRHPVKLLDNQYAATFPLSSLDSLGIHNQHARQVMHPLLRACSQTLMSCAGFM